jgi:uncharacterized membrane protein YeaQ/YmgE (transglycosylase-associated protein family)
MIIQLLILLLVAGICGAIGQAITGYSHGGCLVSIALGFIGALLGSWLAGKLGLPELVALPWAECTSRSSGPSSALRYSWP